MIKMSSFDMVCDLINCIVDHALLETTPEIDQPLLQFIDAIKFFSFGRPAPAAAFLPKLCSHLGTDLGCWKGKGLVK